MYYSADLLHHNTFLATLDDNSPEAASIIKVTIDEYWTKCINYHYVCLQNAFASRIPHRDFVQEVERLPPQMYDNLMDAHARDGEANRTYTPKKLT